MKVNVITFHFAHNFGAVLQCFALQEKLRELGYDVEVINYRPEYHIKSYKCLINPFQYYRNVIHNMDTTPNMRNRVITLVKAVLANRRIIKNGIRKQNFDRFVEKYLQQGMKCATYQDLIDIYGKTKEIFITGSDQVWNRKLIGDDNAYFLCFASEKNVKIAYAASFGDEKVSNIAETAELLGDFDAISIREQIYAIELGNILGRNVGNTLDPTFLLSQSVYRKCEKEIRKIRYRKYILVYSLMPSEKLIIFLNRLLKEEKGLFVVNISRFLLRKVPRHRVMNMQSIGPGEFLTCIKDAWCILTDSFHGMVFSIIYHKKFWTFENKNGSLRLKGLLHELGINNRFISVKSTRVTDVKEEIDYSIVDTLLLQAVARSNVFLEEALNMRNVKV